MRRGVTLAAASLTAFTLVMIASVVYAYRAVAAPRPESPEVAVRSQVALQSPAS